MADETLARSESRFRRLVDALDHAIVWEFSDTHQRYTFVSEHSNLVLGIPCTAWMPNPQFFEQHTDAEDVPKLVEALAQLRSGAANDLRIDHRMTKGDGTKVWIHTGLHRADENGECVIRGVSMDINHLKAAEERERAAREEAQQVLRERDDLMEVISHDLRNPLATILLASADRPTDLEAGLRKLELIARAAHRIERLVEDLEDVGTIQSRTMAVESTEVEIEKLVQDVVSEFHSQATMAGVTLGVSSQDHALIRCDAKRIGQVLSNLVNNAIKFTPKGGSVTVRLVLDALAAKVTVEDTGPGIAADVLPRLFQRRAQAQATAHLGSGLGLYISKGIIDAHAGTLDVESEPGKGTRISFTLPRP